MISIKQLMDSRKAPTGAAADTLQASLQLGRLLLEAISTHLVPGSEADSQAFRKSLQGLVHQLDGFPKSLDLLDVASTAIEAIERYSEQTATYLREQNEQMRAMLAMLTDTVADISGQADLSVARLQVIEQKIEQASRLEDIRSLSSTMEGCLISLREAAALQRKQSTKTVARLQQQIEHTRGRMNKRNEPLSADIADIDLVPEQTEDSPPVETAYVAAFKLQRSEHIASRFGQNAKHEMLSLVSQRLKEVLGPKDRLLRWRGASFVMFIQTSSPIQEIRSLLTQATARTGNHYIEVGAKSALLSVGVDWILFPQSQCETLDAVFAEVDSFLARESNGASQQAKAV